MNTKKLLILCAVFSILTLNIYGCGENTVETKTTEEINTEVINEDIETTETEEVKEVQTPPATQIVPTSNPAPIKKEVKEPTQETSVETDAQLEVKYQSLMEHYNTLQSELSSMSGDTQGLSRDALVNLANEKNRLSTARARYISAGETHKDSLKKQYIYQLDSFESSYWHVKNKYRVK